jgi:protein MpaA
MKFNNYSRKWILLSAVVVIGFISQTYADPVQTTVPLLCEDLEKAFIKRNWGKNPCKKLDWKVGGKSVQGRPLIYYSFGSETANNTTLVFSMVHADEITPLYLGFALADWADQNMKQYPNSRLVIVPFINPDGFFTTPKTRTNANGVDCNRNFNTHDWKRDAIKAWKTKFRSEKRRFPGHQPDSEPETLFQRAMIEQFKPRKIISIHSPLNFIDYDGPDYLTLARFSEEYVQKCVELRKKVKAVQGGFFPGSLGNYSGQELGIPTITLELPTAQYNKAIEYWDRFKKGIVTVINYQVPTPEK